MTAGSNRLGREHQEKRLRVEFSDGEIAEIRVLMASQCDQHTECNGITYDIVSSNRPDRFKKGTTYWTESTEVRTFEVLGE